MYNVFWYLYFLLTTKVRYLRHRFFSCISSLLSFFRLVLSRMDHMNASIILKFSQLVLQSKIVPWRGSFLGYLLTIMFSVFASHVLRQMSLFDLRGRKKVNIKRRYKTACLSRHLKVWPAEHCLALRIVAIYSLEIDHIKYHGENFRSYPCPNLVILFITTSIRA